MAIIERIGKKLTLAGQNVAQQTKNLTEVTQLNNIVTEKEKSISQLYLSIGQSYYEKHKNDISNAEEQEKMNEIVQLFNEIHICREKIKTIKGVVKCSCGADVPVNSSFCNSCGKKIEPTNIKHEEQQVRICPVCNTALGLEDLFCIKCGVKLENKVEELGGE